MPTNLDMDVLRSFVVATDLGGFVHAASQLGRSQSAISLQIKKLEEQVGLGLFRRQGRGVALTDAGDLMLTYARRILELNDEALSAARGTAIESTIRLGLPQDFVERFLPDILAGFHRAHPQIHVQLQFGRSRDLLAAASQGLLDLALGFGDGERVRFRAHLPIVWVGAADLALPDGPPVKLALLDPPCIFRQAGIEALEQARVPCRLALSTPNVSGLWAAVKAGIGITPLTPLGVPEDLRILARPERLPPLPHVQLVLSAGTESLSPAALRLAGLLSDQLAAALPSGIAA